MSSGLLLAGTPLFLKTNRILSTADGTCTQARASDTGSVQHTSRASLPCVVPAGLYTHVTRAVQRKRRVRRRQELANL
eukprot:4552372-Prymnesium_polylepis.1